MGNKYNWPPIRNEYIQGNRIKGDEVEWPTLVELSKKYKMPVQTIEKRSWKEGWVKQRADFQADVERISREKAAKKRARDIEKFDDDCHTISKSGIWRISKEMRDDQEAAREGKPLKPLSDLESIARATERFQTIGHRALGVPDKGIALMGPDGGPIMQETQIILSLEERKKKIEEIKERTKALLDDVDGGSIPKNK